MEQYKTRNQRVSDKFQSCGEIENNRRFEVSVVLKADILFRLFLLTKDR